jgi:hypothetical protein
MNVRALGISSSYLPITLIATEAQYVIRASFWNPPSSIQRGGTGENLNGQLISLMDPWLSTTHDPSSAWHDAMNCESAGMSSLSSGARRIARHIRAVYVDGRCPGLEFSF